MRAYQNGNVKIIVSSGKNKDEKILQGSRVSIALVRTGSSRGSTGPTIYLLKGKVSNSSFSDTFRVYHLEAQ